MTRFVSVLLAIVFSLSSLFAQWNSSPGQYGGNATASFATTTASASQGSYAGSFSISGTSEWNGLENYFIAAKYWRNASGNTPMAVLLEGKLISLSGADSVMLTVGITTQTGASKKLASVDAVYELRTLALQKTMKGERNFVLKVNDLVYLSISERLPADSLWKTFAMDIPAEWQIGNVINIDIDALTVSGVPAQVSANFLLDNIRFQYDTQGNVVIVESFGDNITAVPAGQLPNEFALAQNYPNPFNPATVIRYQVPVASKVKLQVYDVLGNEIAVLMNEVQPAGEHEVQFNASNLASGTYLYVLQAGDKQISKKMILLK